VDTARTATNASPLSERVVQLLARQDQFGHYLTVEDIALLLALEPAVVKSILHSLVAANRVSRAGGQQWELIERRGGPVVHVSATA
jgi:DNA-binding MarR family transcriptional regulator